VSFDNITSDKILTEVTESHILDFFIGLCYHCLMENYSFAHNESDDRPSQISRAIGMVLGAALNFAILEAYDQIMETNINAPPNNIIISTTAVALGAMINEVYPRRQRTNIE